MGARVLVVDDEPGMRRMLEVMLRRAGYDVDVCEDGRSAAVQLEKQPPYGVVITDLVMPEVGGMEVLSAAKARDSSTEVIVITAYATTEAAVEAMRRGAYDYVEKPFRVDEMQVTVEKALEKHHLRRENVDLRKKVSGTYSFGDLIGKSTSMQKVFELCRRVAGTTSNVLLTGESGTGKELVARAIHDLYRQSQGRTGPFVAVNCGAIPATLMESELFGHVRGAFTGATEASPGLFRSAHGGTLFLDEVTEIPRSLQATLLRAIQERRVRPVGSNSEHEVDVRIIAASNRDLEEAVKSGDLREDLYYRLDVIRIALPPLRERREDIPLLAEAFAERHGRVQGRSPPRISSEALRRLSAQPLPGNVRELENLIERAVTFSTEEVLDEDGLWPRELPAQQSPRLGPALPEAGLDLEATLAAQERQLLQAALARTGGKQTAAAKLLGISFRSMRYRLQKHGIAVDGDEEREREEAATAPGRRSE